MTARTDAGRRETDPCHSTSENARAAGTAHQGADGSTASVGIERIGEPWNRAANRS